MLDANVCELGGRDGIFAGRNLYHVVGTDRVTGDHVPRLAVQLAEIGWNVEGDGSLAHLRFVVDFVAVK